MRNYVRKGKPYTQESLQEAIDNVRSKRVSLRAAAKSLGMAPSTLKIKMDQDPRLAVDNRGKTTVLTKGQEQSLADHLRTLTKWGYGLSCDTVLEVVREFCIENDIKTPFKDGKPGRGWFKSFCERQSLKLKNTEPLEKSRRQNTSDPFLIYELYDVLEKEGTDLGIMDKPDHWFNMDEAGINHDPTRSKVVAGSEQSGIHRTNQGSCKENTTVMGCLNAAGLCLPPLFIFKAAKLWSTWKGNNDLKGTTYAVSESGFINCEIFFEYLQRFSRLVP
jgi:hypothetical protein